MRTMRRPASLAPAESEPWRPVRYEVATMPMLAELLNQPPRQIGRTIWPSAMKPKENPKRPQNTSLRHNVYNRLISGPLGQRAVLGRQYRLVQLSVK